MKASENWSGRGSILSVEGVCKFVEQVLTDQGFQELFNADPERALSQFDLTEEERAAIKIGVYQGSNTLKLDDRLSKLGVF